MTTKREQIMLAVKGALTGISGVDNASVYRSRVDPFGQNKLPAITVEPLGEVAQNDIHMVTDWTLQTRINILVKAKIPDQNGDPIVLDVHEKLSASTLLKNLIIDMSINSINFNNFEGDGGLGIIEMNYSIRYRTQENSLT